MAGKYQAYPEYRETGIEWLGSIPTHWETQKISWHFRAEKGKNGQVLTKEYCGTYPGDYPVYSGQTENGGVMGRIESYEFDTGEEGVLFSTTVGAKAMHLSHITGRFSLSQNCMVIEPASGVFSTRYSYYHFQPLFRYERGLIPEHMQASFRMEDLYQYVVARPPAQEQRTIAAFLDHETARIDRLIEKQQRLIELLKEKRQAVISHAVTKGLDPDVPMKDSGVEWLGQVPEHWKVGALRWYLSISSGEHLSNKEFELEPSDENSYPVIGGNGIMGYTSKPNRIDTLVVGRVGALCGNVHLINGSSWITDNALVIRLDKRVKTDFAELYLRALNLNKLANQNTQPLITGSMVKEQPLLLPPKEEQASIVEHVKEQSLKIETLTDRAEKAVKLMKERRTALISAAVTGKIDVRGWQPPAQEDAA